MPRVLFLAALTAISTLTQRAALLAIQRATLQRAYMCQCLNGGSCICGPKRSGCHPATPADLAATSAAAVSRPISNSGTVTPSSSAASRSSLLFSNIVPPSLTHNFSSSASSVGSSASCRTPNRVAHLTGLADALPKNGRSLSHDGASTPRSSHGHNQHAFAPYQIPLHPVDFLSMQPAPSYTSELSTTTATDAAYPPSDMDLTDEPMSAKYEHLSPATLFEQYENDAEAWRDPLGRATKEIPFPSSGGDEDTPFLFPAVSADQIGHLDYPMASSSSTSAPLLEPTPSLDPMLMQYEKEPLGVLFDDWVFGECVALFLLYVQKLILVI